MYYYTESGERFDITDDVIITELLKPRWDMNMFQKKLQTESEPSIIDVDFVEINENQIEMKGDD